MKGCRFCGGTRRQTGAAQGAGVACTTHVKDRELGENGVELLAEGIAREHGLAHVERSDTRDLPAARRCPSAVAHAAPGARPRTIPGARRWASCAASWRGQCRGTAPRLARARCWDGRWPWWSAVQGCGSSNVRRERGKGARGERAARAGERARAGTTGPESSREAWHQKEAGVLMRVVREGAVAQRLRCDVLEAGRRSCRRHQLRAWAAEQHLAARARRCSAAAAVLCRLAARRLLCCLAPHNFARQLFWPAAYLSAPAALRTLSRRLRAHRRGARSEMLLRRSARGASSLRTRDPNREQRNTADARSASQAHAARRHRSGAAAQLKRAQTRAPAHGAELGARRGMAPRCSPGMAVGPDAAAQPAWHGHIVLAVLLSLPDKHFQGCRSARCRAAGAACL